ncbi:methionine-tRNA ligase-like protein [Raphidocelis subcapitata]|uniref:methionine--tRNA ligase n=1 Tax=Raphidocelis subcapitata TaxID=307507 RepID=A0A2V0NRC4_9CHLO|nr:methionine-tRNA ligase-like protein [Raphidocelis subcapitata]|eukprot:GBF87385.1 methionine-tRNA ligase-like protein [Raphidocelis subcapitata]
MATLSARPGDAQALKAFIAAQVSGAALSFAPGDPKNLFGTPSVSLSLPDGGSLSEPNAVASYLAEGSPLKPAGAAAARVAQWLEWEAAVLRPAAYEGGPALDAALAQLAEAAGGGGFLAGGGAPTVADVAVLCTLLPLRRRGDLAAAPPAVESLLSRAEAALPLAPALAAALAGAPEAALLAAFAADAAARAAAAPKRPIPGKRNVLITSALPYVNNVPHLGNIIGCVLSADCYARLAARGYNTLFVCGTDEYGTATETKALEEGLTCQQICDKYHAIHSGIYEWFGISTDRFGRTPTRHQTEICQDLFMRLWERGNCMEQSMEQLYSEAAGKFLADRFVSGTCPKCGYDDARGDQCDGCGGLMNPTELINPRCKITGTRPVVRSTRHVFLDLPRLSGELQSYIDAASKGGGWSSNCMQVTNAWMRDGLKQRCITRDLKWGIPVPLDGFRDKVFYVWFDAPIGYISITAAYTPHWREWWQDPDNVELVQFMGKDNVPFHTVLFPGTLLGSGQRWTLMRSISVTEYLNYEGGKFSKSRGTGVFGNDARDTGLPPEVWRYYLLANRPESADTDFKWSDLQARTNSELLKNLGNLVNRVLMFTAKFYDGVAPPPHPEKGQREAAELGAALEAKAREYVEAMEARRLRAGIGIAMAASTDANKFFTDTAAFRVIKTDPEHAGTIVAACLGAIRLLAALVAPYTPTLTDKILAQLALPAEAALLTDELLAGAASPHTLVPGGHKLGTPAPLVAEIPDEVIEALRVKYAGKQEAAASGTAAGGGGAAAAAGGAAAGGGKAAAAAGGKGAAAAAGGKAAAAAAAGGGKKGGGGGGGGKKDDAPVDVSRLDIRVGFITKAWHHPDAESLYVEEIEVGEDAPRQVVSGLVKHVPLVELTERKVLVLCNLKPAAMRGVTSQAMVLCASDADGKVELIDPPSGAQVGERVTVPGYLGDPDEQLNPKKKIFESVAPDLATDAARVACYKGVPLATSGGPCTAASVAGGGIR